MHKLTSFSIEDVRPFFFFFLNEICIVVQFTNCINRFNDSTLYAPFIERPELIESDYIPLPTVTRKYIDPPSDVLLNSIPSFHIHKKNHIDSLDNLSPSPTTTAVIPLKKPKNKLVVDTKRLDDSSIADIGTWLSRNITMDTNEGDLQQSIPKSTTF